MFYCRGSFERETSPDSIGSEHRVRIDVTDTTDTEIEEEYRRRRSGRTRGIVLAMDCLATFLCYLISLF